MKFFSDIPYNFLTPFFLNNFLIYYRFVVLIRITYVIYITEVDFVIFSSI